MKPETIQEGLRYLKDAENEPELWEWFLRNYGPDLLGEANRLTLEVAHLKNAAAVEQFRVTADVIALRRTIRVVSAAIKEAMPGITISINDKEATRLWNEASQ